MVATPQRKEKIKNDLGVCPSREIDVCRAGVFGLFLTSTLPNDLDVAAFQDGDEAYLSLATKYWLVLHSIAGQIRVDVIPVRSHDAHGQFLDEIRKGEVIYEC
jgi:hypothetical protein